MSESIDQLHADYISATRTHALAKGRRTTAWTALQSAEWESGESQKALQKAEQNLEKARNIYERALIAEEG